MKNSSAWRTRTKTTSASGHPDNPEKTTNRPNHSASMLSKATAASGAVSEYAGYLPGHRCSPTTATASYMSMLAGMTPSEEKIAKLR